MTKIIWLLRVALVVFLCPGLTGFSQTTNTPETGSSLTAPPRVAVFVESGFPVYGGTPSLPPFKMIEVLVQHGIEAQALSAAELSDSTNFNAKRFTVLVMPYGNAFPVIAYENLHKFHKAGGCFVTTSIPFFNPYIKANGQWKEWANPKRISFIGHDAIGFDTGGYGDPKTNEKTHISIPGHPLGLTEGMLPTDLGNHQWLDPQNLDSGDQVLPLVNIEAGGVQHPGMALIRHLGAGFHGARDVWMGQIAEGGDESDRYFAEQVLLRGVLWCELEKGKLTQADFSTQLAALNQIEKPKPLPSNLPYVVTPRPWGDTYLPKSKPPARHLLVVNVGPLNSEERIAITCLQGLTSRDQPRIWVIRRQEDQTCLDWHKEKGCIDNYEVVTNWPDLFKQFSSVYKGAIIPDSNLYRGDVLAVNVAECEDLIVATPELARKLGLPVKIDLRGRFQTYAEGMRWVWTNYKSQLSHHLCRFMYPSLLSDCTFAYDFEWHSVMFWVVGSVDEAKPGADHFAESRLMAEIFSEMDPNIAVLGYPYAGENIGMGEGAGVALGSRYAKGLVCSDFLGNTCVMSGVRIDRMTQPQQPPPPPLDKNSIYIALAMSDGDNQNTWMDYFKPYFNHPSFGKFPLAFGMGPAIRDLMPAVAQWYYKHASPQTEFIADVSGVAYIEPEDYGQAFADRDRVYAGFLDWTARSMQAMGMRTVRPNGGGDGCLALYAKALPFCHSILPNTGSYSGSQGISNLSYSLPDGMPVFRTIASERYGKNAFFREVHEQIGSQRPAFVNSCLSCWTFNPDDLARIYEQRDTNMVFVTPAQLATLYHQAKDKGWVK